MSNNEQPTGYNFELKGKLVKEHECPICLMLIRNATELPCTHLMCRDCLVYYEETELERNENADFLCSLCQEVYHRNEKKEFRSLDRIIRESLEVKCKNWKDGCDWVGNISYYEDHHINVCEFLMVGCPNNGCKEKLQRKAILRHEEYCEYRIVLCEHCEGEFPICWLKDHHKTCPSYPVVCPNSSCKQFVPRKQLNHHCKYECQYQVIPCIYSEVGCTIQLQRQAMENHHQEAMQHHSILLLKSHVDLSKKNQDLEQQLKKSNEKIEQLQETVMKREESIGRQQAEIICLRDNVKKHEELKVKEKLTNLEMFAEETADFFETLTTINFFKDPIASVLFQKDYNDNEIVKKNNNYVEETKDIRKTNCYYLQTLSKAITYCHQVNYATTYEERVRRFSNRMDKDRTLRRDGLYYIKTDLLPCAKICFNIYYSLSVFEAQMKNVKWNRRSVRHATYYDHTERCYYVALFSPGVKDVWLLHKDDEDQSKQLNINEKTLIDCACYAIQDYFIFKCILINS